MLRRSQAAAHEYCLAEEEDKAMRLAVELAAAAAEARQKEAERIKPVVQAGRTLYSGGRVDVSHGPCRACADVPGVVTGSRNTLKSSADQPELGLPFHEAVMSLLPVTHVKQK